MWVGKVWMPNSDARAATRSWVGPTHWPPISTTLPSPRSALRVRPPTRSRASSTTGETPALASSLAATSPASPPPMTATSASSSLGMPGVSPIGRLETCKRFATLFRCGPTHALRRGSGGGNRPLGVVVGLAASFTFATVALVYVLDVLGLPDDLLRTLAIVTLFAFGILLV